MRALKNVDLRRHVRGRGAMVATVGVLAMLAGCGGDDSSNDTSGSAASTADPAPKGDSLATLQKRIDAAKEVPTFTFEGSAFDARTAMAGKRVANVPWGTLGPYPTNIAKAMEAAAKDLGVDWSTIDVKDPSQWQQGVETATAKKPDTLSMLIMDPRAVRPQVQVAKSKGIKVTSAHFWDSSQTALADKEELAGWTGIDYVTPGKLIADWSITDSGGKAHVLIIGGPEFTFNDPVMAAMKAEYDEHCPDCTVKIVGIPSTDWKKKVPSTVVAELAKDPKLNYILPFSDPAAPAVIDGLRQANAVDKVKIAAFGTEPFVLDMLRKGQVEFDCGYNISWSAYAFVDQVMRATLGMPTSTDIKNGLRCFDATNIDEVGVPADGAKGFGDAYLAGYQKLWGAQ